MSFDSMLNHRVTIKRAAVTGSLDTYGQPTTATATVASDVPASIQPRRADEMALASQAGVDIGDHVGFMRPLAGVDNACWLELAGRRFDIIAIVDAAGRGHHWELPLRSVG